MNFKRADRVAELIMAEMSDIIFKQVKDPRVQAITITSVKVTDDFQTLVLHTLDFEDAAAVRDRLDRVLKNGLLRFTR